MKAQRLWMLTAILIFVILFASGCGRRVVLVPSGEPVRLAEPVRAYVYVKIDGKWVKGANRVTLPEGWYCLPVPE